MSCKLFALIEWEDRYLSIISLDSICQPRKETTEYEEGEYIKAKFRGSIYSAVIAEISDDKKHLEENKKSGKLKHTFHDASAEACSSSPLLKRNVRLTPKKTAPAAASSDSDTSTRRLSSLATPLNTSASCSNKPLSRQKTPKKTAPAAASSDSDTSTRRLSPLATPLNTSASCSSKPLSRQKTPKKTAPAAASSDSDTSTPRLSPFATPLNTSASCSSKPLSRQKSPKKTAATSSENDSAKERQSPLATPLNTSGTFSSESETDDLYHEFLSRKSSNKNRDKRKIQHLTKDVEDLKSEVKKLRRRLRALEKTEQKKYPSNDPNEEVLEIPHGEPIKVSELTIATRKCLKAPEAVVFLLNALFSKTEIKNCSISGKKNCEMW